MASQNVNIDVNVSDNGTAKKVVKNFQEIESAASKAQRAAQGINTPQSGTTGSRSVAARAAPSGSQQMMSGEEYGRARGSAGATGASARDFANQAQGLGGLVRLYATYAANIFAVSAAFNALSNAMDTTNMVRGLDQLGTASGVALGSLSKRLVSATDGAVSLREAMTATAKASSSGMSSEQILRMGKVAQKASQALGIDMADALSRISRGVTKLEPELLDELGLFTKTGKAAEDYAKSVGKSVTELTDFEKRAAFANAVLTEGEKKFGQINLDVNPYTKLLASIKDLAQASLEFINKGLAPIVSYLSNSPTALGVAIAALGTVLIKQALPALGEFKAGLASTADKANQLSVQKAQDAAKARLAIDANILTKVEAMADYKVAAVDAAEQKIQALEASGINKKSAAYKLLQKDIADVTKADIAAVEARAKAAENAGDTKRAAAYRAVTSAVLEHKQAEEDLILTKKNLSTQLEKDAAGMTTYGMTVRAAEKAQTAATRAGIISNAAYNGSLIGVTASMTLMRAEMQLAGIATNTFAGGLLLARGALAAVGGMVSTVMAAFGPLMLIITAVSLVFSLLDGAMSKNNKESAELSGSLDKLDANASHLTKTMDTINQKPFLERMSPESLKVKATALGEVGTAISSTITDLLKADKAASGWDKFIDGFKTVVGTDMLSNTSESLATAITSGLSNIAGSPEAKALNKDLSNILKIDTETATFEQVQDSIKKIGRESPQQLKLVEESFKKISLASLVTAAKGTEVIDSFKKLSDLKQTIGNKFLPTDDITKFGQELVATSQKLSIALDDPQQKLNAIIQLSANAASIPGATFEQVSALSEAADLAKNIQVIEAKQLENKQDLIKKQEELSKLIGKERAASIAAGEEPQLTDLTGKRFEQVSKLKDELKELKSTGEINIKVKTELTSKLQGYSKEIETATLGTYKAGADLVAKQISAEFIKAGKVVSDAYVNIIGETEGTIKIKADSEKAVVNAQIQQILSQRDLTIATRELSLRMQESSLQKYLERNPEAGPDVQKKLDALKPQFEAVEAAKTGDFSKLKLSTNVKDLKDVNVEALNFAQNMRASGAAVGNLRAQIKAIDIGALDAITVKKFEPQKKSLETQEKSLALAKQELDVQGKLVTQGNLSFLNAKQSQDTEQLRLQQAAARLDNQVQIARQENIIKDPKAAENIKKDAASKKAELLTAAETLKTQQQQQQTTLASTQAQEKLSAEAFTTEETRKREADNAELTLNKRLEQLKIEQDLFGMYSSLGLLSETQKVNQQFLLSQKSAELDYEQKIAKAKSSQGQQLGALDAREKAIRETLKGATEGTDYSLQSEELGKIAEARALIVARTDQEALLALKVRDNTVGIANAIKTAGLEQERYNQLLENSGALAESLGNVFGEVGSKLGSLAESLTKIAISSEQGAKALEKIGKDADSAYMAGNIDQAIELEKDYEKQKKKNTRTELDSNLKVISGTKSLFNEKTFAYKALDKVEKAMHLYRLAMDAKELAIKLGNMVAATTAKATAEATDTGLTFSGTLARLPAYAAEIYGKTIGQLGPIAGPVVATALVASMFNMFGKGVSGGISGTGGAVENDGTGTVFGDSKAKSDTIPKSIEIVQPADPVLMRNSSNMLKHLRSIDSNIAQFGVNLTRSINPGGYFNEQMGAVNAKTGFKDFALEFLPGLNKIPGANIVNSIAKALGTGVSTSVRGSGLQYGGQTLGDATRTGLDANFFADIEKTYNLFGIKLGTSGNRSNLGMDADLQLSLNRVFESIPKLVLSASKSLGFDQQAVSGRLENYEIKAQTITFSGTDAEKRTQLEAAIGKEIDLIYKEALPGMEAFIKANETYGTTAARVAYGVDEANAALETLSIQAIKYTDILDKQGDVGAELVRQSIVAQESNQFIVEVLDSLGGSAAEIAELYTSLDTMRNSVIEFGGSAEFLSEEAFRAAGGLSQLGDAISSFYDKFTVDTQKTANNNRKVIELFDQLNLTIPKTREQVLTLVNALTITDKGAAAKIMEATNKLNEFYNTIEKLQGNLKSMQMRILELTGTAANLLEAQRANTLEEIDPNLRAVQQYIYALEDVKTAEENLTKARQAEANTLKEQQKASETSVDGLKRYIDSIFKFKNSLLLGSLSPLTPAQKYAEAKNQFDAILATATSTAVTPAEKSAKEAALGQLEGSASAFLEASKTYNASSQTYQNDFSYVQQALTSTSESLAQQLSAEERTLEALTQQLTALETLNTSTLSVADAVYELGVAVYRAGALKPASTDQISNVTTGTNLSFRTKEQLLDEAKTGNKAIIDNGMLYGFQGASLSIKTANTQIMDYIKSEIDNKDPKNEAPYKDLYNNLVNNWKLSSTQVGQILGIPAQQVNDFFKPFGLPAFAKGTNFVPEDMIAQIHQGERIIPAADNAIIMQSLTNRNETNRVLVTEIQNLRNEVKQLREQQAAETGNIIIANFDAQQRAAEQIEAAVSNTAQQSNWTGKVRDAVKLK